MDCIKITVFTKIHYFTFGTNHATIEKTVEQIQDEAENAPVGKSIV